MKNSQLYTAISTTPLHVGPLGQRHITLAIGVATKLWGSVEACNAGKENHVPFPLCA